MWFKPEGSLRSHPHMLIFHSYFIVFRAVIVTCFSNPQSLGKTLIFVTVVLDLADGSLKNVGQDFPPK